MAKMTPEQRRRQTQAVQRLQARNEKRLQQKLLDELDRAAMSAADAYPNWKPTIAEHQTRLSMILTVSLPRSAVAAARIAKELYAEPIALNLNAVRYLPTQDELDARIASIAKERALSRSEEIASTTETRIGNSIARGLDADEAPREIAQRIMAEVPDMDEARANMIARTETAVATQTGQYQEMEATSEALGINLAKTWVASSDDRTRETHAEADGQTVAMDGVFHVGDAELDHPSDPNGPPEEVINCRCGIVFGPVR